MAIPTIDLFTDNETPTTSKMNQPRQALITALAGALTGDNIGWPLVAQGDLDMNGNSLYNFSSITGAQHVNSSKSLATAIAAASTDGKVIVIDPGFTATANNITVADDDVTIMGYGADCKIECTNAGSPGITVSGDNFTMKNLEFTGNSAGTDVTNLLVLNGDNATISGVTFTGDADAAVAAIGGGSDISISGCTFDTDEYSVRTINVTGLVISGNKFSNGTHPVYGGGVISAGIFSNNEISAATSTIYNIGDISIINNIFDGAVNINSVSATTKFDCNHVEGALGVDSSAVLSSFNCNTVGGTATFAAGSAVSIAFGNHIIGLTSGMGTATTTGGTSAENTFTGGGG